MSNSLVITIVAVIIVGAILVCWCAGGLGGSGCGTRCTKEAFDIMCTEQRSSEIAVDGKLVDLGCYSMNLRNAEPDHVKPNGKTTKNCAMASAKAGVPVGLLCGGLPGNKVYVLLTTGPELAQYMGKQTRVLGRYMYDSGAILPSKIEVYDPKTHKYNEVKLK
jgi:hypothetical protein